MRFALLICLFGTGITGIQSASTAPSARQSAISQIVVTQYTGSNASHPNAEPIYRILLRRDGTAVYVGSKNYMKRTGRYHGTVDQRDFLRMANLFQQSSFQKWKSSYNEYNDREVASEKFEIVYGNQKKTIVAYQDSGPQAVRRASKIAYGLLWKIRWHKASESDAIAN